MAFDFTRAVGRGSIVRALLMGGAALSGPLAAPALAQEAVSATTAVSDELVVTARRPLKESEEASLAVQKASDSLVSVLSADAIGRLPDQNIAYAVGRLPGVGVERDQGQARYVNLRGAPIYWTTVSFDGLGVVSPEGRNSRFDNIPSAIASQVIVTKALTPNLSGDTVAGNVNIITRSAFDYDKRTVFGNVALGYVTLGGGEESDNSLVIADQFLDGKLGVLLQGSFYHRNMVTDNWETDPYLTATTATRGLRFAREYENKPYRLTRENESLSARVDYRFNDQHSVFAQSVFTQYYDEELRSNYIFRFDRGRGPTVGSTTGPQANPTNTEQSGTVFAAQITQTQNSRESREYISTSTLGGESLISGWDIDWRLNFTQTEDGIDAPALASFASPGGNTPTDAANLALRPTVVYNFTDGDNNTVALYRTIVTGTGATATLARGERIFSIDNFSAPLTTLNKETGRDITLAYTGKVDASYDTELFGRDTTLTFGALYTDRTKTRNVQQYSFTPALLAAAGLGTVTFDQIANGRPYLGEYALGYAFRYFSKDALERIVNQAINSRVAGPTAFGANEYYKVTEEILAGYGMAKVDFDWGNVVLGARVERTQNTGLAFPILSTTLGRNRIQVSSEDTMVYPSINVNVDVTEEWKGRIGLTTSASRPDFDDLRPNFSVDDANQTVSGGNPDAGPEKQVGIDAYLEWYGAEGGYFSVGAFYKDISDVLFRTSAPFGSSVLNSGTVDRSGYAFTTLRNGGDGHLQGLELAFSHTAENFVNRAGLPDWLGGFGLRANAVFTESEVTVPAIRNAAGVITSPERKVPVLGTSDYVYNIQGTYEKYGLSVRLAYQFRTAWGQSIGDYTFLNGVPVPSGNGDIYWDDDGELDLSVRYELNSNLEWYFDAVNLTDQGGRRYADKPQYPIEFETFGPRYIMGVRFNF